MGPFPFPLCVFRVLGFADASEPVQQLFGNCSCFWFPCESHSPGSSPVLPQAAVLPFTPGFAVVPGRDGPQGLSAVVEGFVSALPTSHFPKDLVARGGGETVVNSHQSQNPQINILSPKQLEVLEVLFGAYSSEPLCQGGIFIIKKKNKLAVVHLAELNSKVIRVVYAFLIKSSFETNVRIKWYYTINIQGR